MKRYDLMNLFFPKDKSKCQHVALSDYFVKTTDGCVMKCANCGKRIVKTCEDCAVGEALQDLRTGELVTVLPCDAIRLRKSLRCITAQLLFQPSE